MPFLFAQIPSRQRYLLKGSFESRSHRFENPCSLQSGRAPSNVLCCGPPSASRCMRETVSNRTSIITSLKDISQNLGFRAFHLEVSSPPTISLKLHGWTEYRHSFRPSTFIGVILKSITSPNLRGCLKKRWVISTGYDSSGFARFDLSLIHI